MYQVYVQVVIVEYWWCVIGWYVVCVQQCLYLCYQFLCVEWFGYVVVGVGIQCVYFFGFVGVYGQYDYWYLVLLVQLFQDFVVFYVWQVDIQDYQVYVFVGGQLQVFLVGGGFLYLIVLCVQVDVQELVDLGFIIDYQYVCGWYVGINWGWVYCGRLV